MSKQRLVWLFAAVGLIFALGGATQRGSTGRYEIEVVSAQAGGAWAVRIDTATGEAWRTRIKSNERSHWRRISNPKKKK